jgi:MATE family multidrug resistance protein
MSATQYSSLEISDRDEDFRSRSGGGGGGEVDGGAASLEESEILEATTVFLKTKLLLSRGMPVVGSFFISYMSAMIIMLYASHYGFAEGNSDVLAGVTLANLFSNVSLFSLLVGLSTAVETLASQHYGAKNYDEVGIVLQRSVCILGTVSIPLLMSWVFAPRLFAYCGIDPAVVTIISNLLPIRALSFPAEVLNMSYEKYLCAMGVTTPTLLYTIAMNAILLMLLPLFVLVFKLPYESIIVGQVISIYCSLFVHVWVSLPYEAVQKTLRPLHRRALTEWGTFLGLGIPGAAMICSEWWAYEIVAFFASRLGTSSVAAQSLMQQVILLAYMVPLGFSIATASLVGNALGAKQRSLAIEFARLAYVIIFVVDFGLALCMYYGGRPFIHVFSNDPEVINIFESMLLFLSFIPFVDGNQSISSGIMRGTGKQSIGAMINFASFYFLGIPCSWYVGFSMGYGVRGLLKGLYVGVIFQTIVLAVMVLKYDDYIFGDDDAITDPNGTNSIVDVSTDNSTPMHVLQQTSHINAENDIELAAKNVGVYH